MRQTEMKECLRAYRSSVKAYCELIDLVTAVEKSLQGLPDGLASRGSKRRLRSVEKDLVCLGDALSMVPELVELLEEERRVGDLIRQQAARAGIVFRYDLEPPPEPPEDEEIDEELSLGAVDGLPDPDDWKDLLRMDFVSLEDFE